MTQAAISNSNHAFGISVSHMMSARMVLPIPAVYIQQISRWVFPDDIATQKKCYLIDDEEADEGTILHEVHESEDGLQHPGQPEVQHKCSL